MEEVSRENLVVRFDDFIAHQRKVARVTGDFSSSGSHVMVGPGLEIERFGLLALPVDKHVAAALKSVVHPCSTGVEEWSIDASSLHFSNPDWQAGAPLPFIRALSLDLLVPAGATCVASLRKLIVSGPGSEGSMARQVCEAENGSFGTLLVFLPSKWEGGTFNVQHGNKQRSCAWEPKLGFGGTLQYIAFFSECPIEVSPVTSGYRVILAYRLSLLSPTGSAVPFSAPPTCGVPKLAALLRSWCSIVEAQAKLDMLPDRGVVPQRALLVLDHNAARSVPKLEALEGPDRALCTLVQNALRECCCPSIGAYLACLKVTEKSTADRPDYDEDEEDNSDEFDEDDLDWEVDSTTRTLKGWVRLLDGVPLLSLAAEDITTAPQDIACFPAEALDDIMDDEADSSFIDKSSYAQLHSTRKYRRVVLIIEFVRDVWRDFAAIHGLSSAFSRISAFIARQRSPPECDEVTTHGLQHSDDDESALLAASLANRGPLNIITSLFEAFFVREARETDTRSLKALIGAVFALPVSRATTDLTTRMLSSFAIKIIETDPEIIVAVFTMYPSLREPVDIVCQKLRQLRLDATSATFSGVLRLVRSLLEPAGRELSSSVVVEAGMKRKRGSSDEGLIQWGVNHVGARSLDVEAWLAACGCEVLATTARVVVLGHASGAGSVAADSLVALLREHAECKELSAFVQTNLCWLVTNQAVLPSLIHSHHSEYVGTICDAIIAGIPSLSARPVHLLRLIAHLFRLCPDLSSMLQDHPTGSLDDHAVASSAPTVSHAGADFAGVCSSLVTSLPVAPVETMDITLTSTSMFSSTRLGLRVDLLPSAPTSLLRSAVHRVLQVAIDAWPSRPEMSLTSALLKMLVHNAPAIMTSRFVNKRSTFLLKYALESLIDALFLDGAKLGTASALWDALNSGLQESLMNASIYASPYSLDCSNALGALASKLVARHKALRKSAEKSSSTRHRDILKRCSLLLHTVVGAWPNVRAGRDIPETLLLFRALVHFRCAPSAVLLLPHLSNDAVLAIVSESKSPGDPFLTKAVKNLGWIPFGVALGQRVSTAAQTDLTTASTLALKFVDAMYELIAQPADGSLESVRAVTRPTVSAVLDAVTGGRRVPFNGSLEAIASFVSSNRVEEIVQSYEGKLLRRWIQYACSPAGMSVYSLSSLAAFAERSMNTLQSGTAGALPRAALVELLDALILSESSRMSVPVPLVNWTRKPLCSQDCSKNPDGPTSCARVNAFLAHPEHTVATFQFTNMVKLNHVMRLFAPPRPRYSYGYTGVVSLFRTQLEGKVLTVTKLPDPQAASAYNAAVAQRTSDQRRLAQLNRLLATCRLGARVTGSASHSVPRVSNGDQLATTLPSSKPEKSNPKPFCAPRDIELPDDAHRQPESGSRSPGPTGRLGPAGPSPGGAGAGGPAGIPSQAPAKSSTPRGRHSGADAMVSPAIAVIEILDTDDEDLPGRA